MGSSGSAATSGVLNPSAETIRSLRRTPARAVAEPRPARETQTPFTNGRAWTTRAWRKAAKAFIQCAAETFAEEGVGLEEIEQRLTEERARTKALEAQGITNRMGDRLPIESVQLTERGYPGAKKQGPVEGVESVPDPYELTEDEIRKEDAELARE